MNVKDFTIVSLNKKGAEIVALGRTFHAKRSGAGTFIWDTPVDVTKVNDKEVRHPKAGYGKIEHFEFK